MNSGQAGRQLQYGHDRPLMWADWAGARWRLSKARTRQAYHPRREKVAAKLQGGQPGSETKSLLSVSGPVLRVPTSPHPGTALSRRKGLLYPQLLARAKAVWVPKDPGEPKSEQTMHPHMEPGDARSGAAVPGAPRPERLLPASTSWPAQYLSSFWGAQP